MTDYGTSRTSSNASPVVNPESSSEANHSIIAMLPQPHTWRVMFDYHSMNLPRGGVSVVFSRIKTNLAYFKINYAIIVWITVFLSLIKHPISLMLLVVLVSVWIFVLFYRFPTEKIAWFFALAYSANLVFLLFLTTSTMSIVVVVLIGAVLVLIHAVFRKTEDLFLDEEAATTTTETSGLTSHPSS